MILNVRCKHGRHRSLGWACLTAEVLLLYGVRVQIFIERGRLRLCHECSRTIRKMKDSPMLREGIECHASECCKRIVNEPERHPMEEYIEWLDYSPYGAALDDPEVQHSLHHLGFKI